MYGGNPYGGDDNYQNVNSPAQRGPKKHRFLKNRKKYEEHFNNFSVRDSSPYIKDGMAYERENKNTFCAGFSCFMFLLWIGVAIYAIAFVGVRFENAVHISKATTSQIDADTEKAE